MFHVLGRGLNYFCVSSPHTILNHHHNHPIHCCRRRDNHLKFEWQPFPENEGERTSWDHESMSLVEREHGCRPSRVSTSSKRGGVLPIPRSTVVSVRSFQHLSLKCLLDVELFSGFTMPECSPSLGDHGHCNSLHVYLYLSYWSISRCHPIQL